MSELRRSWCARIRYPGKRELVFGNVFADPRAPQAEVEQALAVAIDAVLPEGWEHIALLPGAIWFAPEKELEDAA